MDYIEFKDNSINFESNLEDKLLQNESDCEDKKKLEDKDLKRIYKYYIHKGYHNILLLELVNLGSTIFMVFFILFLVKCIDYRGIKKIPKENDDYIWDYVNWNNLVEKSFLDISFLFIFGIYISMRILTLLEDLKIYYRVKVFLKKKLRLDTYDILHMEWSHLVKKIMEEYNLNPYDIHSQILRKENIMVSVFHSKINVFIFSKLMEWNVMYGIFNTLESYLNLDCITVENLQDENKYQEAEEEQFLVSAIDNVKKQKIYFKDRNKIKKKCISNFLVLSLLTYLFMPFIFIYVLFFSFLKYGERYYHNPAKITYRQWSLNSIWKLRYFQELPHEVDMRLDAASKYSRQYLDFYKSRIFNTLVKFWLLVLSSIFMVLILLSIVNENILLNLNISDDKHVLWYLGILASIIALGRGISKIKNIKPGEPDLVYQKIIYYNPLLEDSIDNLSHLGNKKYEHLRRKKTIVRSYIYQLLTLMKETLTVLIVPVILIYICNYLDSILDRIEEELYYDEKLGFISYQSNFRLVHQDSSRKTLLSFKEFRQKYPEWGANIEIYQLGENSKFKDDEKIDEKDLSRSIFDKTMESEISII